LVGSRLREGGKRVRHVQKKSKKLLTALPLGNKTSTQRFSQRQQQQQTPQISMKQLFRASAVCATALLVTAVTTQAQTIVNGSFETSPAGFTANPITVATVDQGWATFGGGNGGTSAQNNMSASAYTPYSGSYALLETAAVGNGWNPSGAYQIISGITPGQKYTFGIWALTDTVNTAPNGILVQLGFYDSLLTQVSSVENPNNTVGINGLLPTIGTWTYYSVSATAPAGYTDAVMYVMFQDNNSAVTTENMFFDNASLTVFGAVPEPSTFALLGMGTAALMVFRRRN
jgi:hypothetical protein